MIQSADDQQKKEQLFLLLRPKFKYRNVPDDDLRTMVSFCTFGRFSKNSFVVMPGDEVKYLHFILSGSLENYLMNSDAAKKILNTLHAGDDFSMPDLVHARYLNTKAPNYSECIEDCEFALIEKKVVFDQVLTIPSVNFAYMEMMVMIIHELWTELIIPSAESKVAAYLCYLIKDMKDSEGHQNSITRKFTMQKISEILFLSREKVHRILSDFEKRGIIAVIKKEISVLNREALKSISEDSGPMNGFYGSHTDSQK